MNQTQQTQKEEYRLASFGIRAAAYLLDIIIVTVGIVICELILTPAMFLMSDWLSQDILFTMSLEDIIWWTAIVAYFSLTTWMLGGTLGKKIVGIQVISTENRPLKLWEIIYRELPGRFLTTVTVIGYFMATGNRKHQTIHDMLSDTQVVCGREKIVPAVKKQEMPKSPMELYGPDAASEYGL